MSLKLGIISTHKTQSNIQYLIINIIILCRRKIRQPIDDYNDVVLAVAKEIVHRLHPKTKAFPNFIDGLPVVPDEVYKALLCRIFWFSFKQLISVYSKLFSLGFGFVSFLFIYINKRMVILRSLQIFELLERLSLGKNETSEARCGTASEWSTIYLVTLRNLTLSRPATQASGLKFCLKVLTVYEFQIFCMLFTDTQKTLLMIVCIDNIEIIAFPHLEQFSFSFSPKIFSTSRSLLLMMEMYEIKQYG